MAGHSKWANIKHKKAREDAARGKVFTKLIRELTVAAREGGGDPSGNPRLRLAIEKAKRANMPRDNIEKAIKRGTGELSGVTYEQVTYEGYGPGGIAVVVDALTDNKKRTVAELRHIFSKAGGNLAEGGAVLWMFSKKGVVQFDAAGKNEDELLEELLDLPVEDIEVMDEGMARAICESKDLYKVEKGLKEKGFRIESAVLEWIPKERMEVSPENEEKAIKLLEAIQDHDDVQNVYTNMK